MTDHTAIPSRRPQRIPQEDDDQIVTGQWSELRVREQRFVTVLNFQGAGDLIDTETFVPALAKVQGAADSLQLGIVTHHAAQLLYALRLAAEVRGQKVPARVTGAVDALDFWARVLAKPL